MKIFQAMLKHSSITECAVIPVPDEIKGLVPLGVAVLKAGKQSILSFIIKLVPIHLFVPTTNTKEGVLYFFACHS